MKTHYQKVLVKKKRFCNTTDMYFYQEKDALYTAKPLYPVLKENKCLRSNTLESLNLLSEGNSNIIAGSLNLKTPYDRTKKLTKKDYKIVNKPIPFSTIFITYWMVRKDKIKDSVIEYYIVRDNITGLAKTVEDFPDNVIFSNFGFFVTQDLIYNGRPKTTKWAHNKRYSSKYHIPDNLAPYLGFYYIKKDSDIYSTFQDFPRSSVGIKKSGIPEIISCLKINNYSVKFADNNVIKVEDINSFKDNSNITLYTPSLSTLKIKRFRKDIESTFWNTNTWQNYKEIIMNGRYNVFISNVGKGKYPEDKVICVWEDKFPVTAFGGVLSFDKEYFNKIFGSLEKFKSKNLKKRIRIIPKTIPSLKNYKYIYSAAVPIIDNFESIFNNKSLSEIMLTFQKLGNFTSPNFQLSLESKNLSPLIRDPRNLLFETEDYIGNVMFSGRYEMSIGACLMDQVIALQLMEDDNMIPQKIKNVIVLDGGSGAKVIYYYNKKLHSLNIPSAGFRNALGDPSANFYSGIVFSL